MRFNHGITPDSEYIKPDILGKNEPKFYNGQTGIYESENKYFIIGKKIFLEYATISDAKEDWFGMPEAKLYELIRKEGDYMNEDSSRFEVYEYKNKFYRVHAEIAKIIRCTTKKSILENYSSQGNLVISNSDEVEQVDSFIQSSSTANVDIDARDDWDDMFGSFSDKSTTQNKRKYRMITLQGLPEKFKHYQFPFLQDEETITYCDEALFEWFSTNCIVRFTLLNEMSNYLPKKRPPELKYIVEYEKEYYVLDPFELSVTGRYLYPEIAMEDFYHEEVLEGLYEIDYVKYYGLDNEPDDLNSWYAIDDDLCSWITENGSCVSSYSIQEQMTGTFTYSVYELFGGCFVVDRFEDKVSGKYSSLKKVLAMAAEGGMEEDGKT